VFLIVTKLEGKVLLNRLALFMHIYYTRILRLSSLPTVYPVYRTMRAESVYFRFLLKMSPTMDVLSIGVILYVHSVKAK
jgi:hypothetical protein